MNDPFASIADSAKSAAPPSAQWVPTTPVPDNAPTPPESHPRLGKPSQRWTYRAADGLLLGYVCRFNSEAGEKCFRPLAFFAPAAGGASRWRWETWPAPRPLYGLDLLEARRSAPVLLTEGEKAADAAGRLLPDHVAIASPNGSKSASKADWSALRGRRVTIWPDADTPGAAYAEAAARLVIAAGAASVALLSPPENIASGWDAADAEAEGWTEQRAAALLATAKTFAPKTERKDSAVSAHAEKPEAKSRRVPQRDKLMAVTEKVSLWHDASGVTYATWPINGHLETWPVKSAAFRRWLSCESYEVAGEVPGGQALEDTLRILEARAHQFGDEREAWIRAGAQDGKLFLDLCDKTWRVVEISADGWRVVENARLPFVRSSAMRPLPEPLSGSGIDILRRYINADESDFRLVVAWLLAALRSRGPYPVLVAAGEQGSGKSSFTRLLRSLVDPNAAPIRAAPRDDRDLLVAAVNGHVIALDNMSKVEPWLADGLCRLSTGGGFAARQLHTDKDEMIFYATRPIILNGIPMLTDRPDLADRAITIRLKTIPEHERLTEDDLDAAWRADAPRVLGSLLDAMSVGLRELPKTRLARAPRLADFAKWGVACEAGLGWSEGSFLDAYAENRRDLADGAFEADPVATAIAELAASVPGDLWTGTPTELLAALGEKVAETVRRSRAWPMTAQGLGNRIDRVAPLLRQRGVTVTRKHSGIRLITIHRTYDAAALSETGGQAAPHHV